MRRSVDVDHRCHSCCIRYIRKDTKASRLLGEIMEKLQASIGKATEVLASNPTLALQLPVRGYSKVDVKKAYRKHALKYHPGSY